MVLHSKGSFRAGKTLVSVGPSVPSSIGEGRVSLTVIVWHVANVIRRQEENPLPGSKLKSYVKHDMTAH